MREIKFRGIHFKSQQMVFGCLILGEIEGRKFAQIENPVFDDYQQWEVDPDTVGQLLYKSKDKKEWFTDDIVKMSISRADIGNSEELYYTPGFEGYVIGVLTILTSKGAVLKNCTFYDTENETTEHKKGYTPISFYRSEVIGNIHQNPELLENGKK